MANEPNNNQGDLLPGGLTNPMDKTIRPVNLPELPSVQRILGDDQSGTEDTAENFISDMIDQYRDPEAFANQPLYKTKNWAYDAGYKGHNIQRYTHLPNVYEKLGFSPWRDNESLYREETSWFEDWTRSAVGMGHIAQASFTSMLPWNAYSGETADRQATEAMEKWQSIAYSGKEGFGGFMNDMQLNFGFTAGMIGEFALEEVAMWGGTAALSLVGAGEVAAPAAAARTGTQAARIGKALKNMFKSSSLLSKSFKTLDGIKDIRRAEEVYNLSKSGKIGKRIGDFIAPHSLSYAKDLRFAAKRGDKIADLAKISKGFGAFYRDTRLVAATLSEAKIEAGLVEKTIFDDLYKEARLANPDARLSPNDIEAMKGHAYDAGYETFWWNVPMLYLSNKIVFDRAFKGLIPMTELRLGAVGTAEYEAVLSKSALKEGGDAVKLVKNTFKSKLASLGEKSTYRPKTMMRNILKGIGKYSKANFAEGIQETYQESISKAMTEYYEELYRDPAATTLHGKWSHILDAAKYMTSSKEGLNVFASGFLMGGLAQGPQHLMYKVIPANVAKLTHKGDFKEYRRSKEKEYDKVVDAMNAAIKDPGKFNNLNLENLVSQKNIGEEYVKAVQDDDAYEAMNNEDEGTFKHLNTLIRTGRLESTIDFLESLKTMSADEMTQAFGKIGEGKDAKEYYTKQIDGFIEKSKKLLARRSTNDKLFPNPYQPHRFSITDPRYFVEKIKHETYEQMKDLALFANYSFDRTLSRMSKIMDSAVKDEALSEVSEEDFSLIFDRSRIDDRIKFLKDEVSFYKEGDASQQKQGKDLSKKLDSLKELRDTITKFQVKLKTYNQGGQESDLLVADYKKAIKEFRTAFKDYLNILTAETKQGKPSKSTVDDLFTKMMDYYNLDVDSDQFAYAVRMLHDKDFFNNSIREREILNEKIHERRLDSFKQSAKADQAVQGMNQLLNDLLNIDVYFDPKQLGEFINGKFPTALISVETGDALYHNDPKFIQAQNIIAKYEEVYDFTFINKPISETRADLEEGEGRKKLPGDERTYRDLAEQFGFNPNQLESEVPMSDVLAAIAKSSYATAREKALASQLLSIVGKQQQVKFRKNHPAAGSYSETTGVVIDARYSSEDYNGRFPIEYIVLHQQVHYILDKALEEDTDFKLAIGEVLKATQDHFNEQQKTKPSKVLIHGLKGTKEFVAEVMTSQKFQKYLSNIDYKSTGTSTWKKVLDTILDKLRAIFTDKEYTNTALNEAMYLITTKIDDLRSAPAAPDSAPSKSDEDISKENKKLTELGYTKNQIINLTESEIEKILKENIKQEDRNKPEPSKDIKSSDEVTEETFEDFINEIIESDESVEEKTKKLKELQDKIVSLGVKNKLTISSEAIVEKFKMAQMSINKTIIFDNLNIGDQVLIDGTYMFIEDKKDAYIIVVSMDPSVDSGKIAREDVSKVISKVTDSATDIGSMNEDNRNASNQSVADAASNNDVAGDINKYNELEIDDDSLSLGVANNCK